MSSDTEMTKWTRRMAREDAETRRRVVGPPSGSRFFHGGPAGLVIGAKVKPPAVTGAKTNHESAGLVADTEKYGWVHVATLPDLALVFTDRYKPGAVYEVEPKGEIVPDDEHDTDVSWMCESAVVREIARPGLTVGERKQLREFRKTTVAYIEAHGIESLADSDLAILEVLSDDRVTMRPGLRSALIQFCGGRQ